MQASKNYRVLALNDFGAFSS